ncbi:MAG: hypothetical protein A3J58_03390 [Candidatus Sungbacteria bacterium RIFCSPHIGHO2_02_FULL_52_23]|uniref:Antitoxin n=1 Tax=Candidatus Sungbacteria bacterium RIFCSPHIGHO2_02_FULL_52_23 TaxID=1802274 RepID=A0A1G2KX64_9BACT|nr:MAG: hypothetical protein A3J58_03390 [Candidatus Sungbacteria bacterium RIFCSPHIGHO2_02_FULL_52_23]
MDAKTTLSISEARRRIFEIAEDVQKPNTHFTLTENGRPKVVIMSAEEFESWQETVKVLSDFPDLKKDIAEAERQFAQGEYSTLEELLAREGFVVADKSNKRYAVSRRHTKKGKARARKDK